MCDLHEPLEARTLLAANPLLPDLTPWVSSSKGYLHDWSIDTTTRPGRTLLRLTAATSNIGKGVMQIRGGTPNPDGETIPVRQRIFNSDGTHKDRHAGTFIHHPTHQHVHFEDFTEYDLLARGEGNSVGRLVAGGSKTSFCLEDVDAFDTSLPGAPSQPVYLECDVKVQGISVGWADVYHKSLDGQEIDITGVPSGKYWLQMVDDPLNRLVESNENNNVARIPIDLHFGDDKRSSAFNVGTLGASASYDEFVGTDDLNDYYRFTVASRSKVDLKLNQLHEDADLRLLNSSGSTLASSLKGGSESESISRTLEAGTYYVHVFSVGLDTTYHLSLSRSGAQPPPSGTTTSTLIRAGGTWRYLDDGSDQKTDWRGLNAKDAKWKTGNSQLGYGDGDEATKVKFGSNSSRKHITTYFRKRFTITNKSAVQALTARLIRDDGAVVYLNGKEVWRSNMPSGSIGYKTLASSSVEGGDESKWFTKTLDKSNLINGTNVIAVEIHQRAATSGDISFNFELKATVKGTHASSSPTRMAQLFSQQNAEEREEAVI